MPRQKRMPGLIPVLALLVAASASAAPELPPSNVPDAPVFDPTSVEAQRMVEALYGDEWTWLQTGPKGLQALDMSCHPADPTRWAMVREDLSVWVTDDRGLTWQQVLGDVGRASTDEDVLLGIDARVQEVTEGGFDLGDADYDLDESEFEDAVSGIIDDALADAADQATGDMASDPEFLTGQAGVQSAHGRVFYTDEGTLFAAIGERLHMSLNDGRTWTMVLDERVYGIHRVGAMYVALTADGARVALHPRAWFDVLDGTEGQNFVEAVHVGGMLVAASDEGLWATSNGETWSRWSESRAPIFGLVNHPEQPDRVFGITPEGVALSTDGARSFSSIILYSRQVTGLTMPVPARLVVVREGAALETLDSGRSWHPLQHGLERISEGRIAPRPDGGLLLGTLDGGWALIRDRRLVGLTAPAPWIEVESLLDAAQTRDPLRAPNLGASMRMARYFVPRLRVAAGVWGRNGPRWRATHGTDAFRDQDWTVKVELEWVTGSRGVDGDFESVPSVDVAIIDGEPFVMTGETSVAAAARLSWVDARYRADVSQQVVNLHRTRNDLVSERTAILRERLFRRVLHELHIAEVEARLDALTDGALNRWTAQRATNGEQQ
jgi:hypothetical protein